MVVGMADGECMEQVDIWHKSAGGAYLMSNVPTTGRGWSDELEKLIKNNEVTSFLYLIFDRNSMFLEIKLMDYFMKDLKQLFLNNGNILVRLQV